MRASRDSASAGGEELTAAEQAKANAELEHARSFAARKQTLKASEWGGGLRAAGVVASPVKKKPLTQADLEALCARIRRRLKADSYTMNGANMEALFQRMDKDGSGELSTSEMKAALRKWGIVDAAELKALVSFIDSDADGVIDITEFVHFLDGGAVGAEPSAEAKQAVLLARRKQTLKVSQFQSSLRSGSSASPRHGSPRPPPPPPPGRKAAVPKQKPSPLKTDDSYDDYGGRTTSEDESDAEEFDGRDGLELEQFQRQLTHLGTLAGEQLQRGELVQREGNSEDIEEATVDADGFAIIRWCRA